jgi:pseudouridine-5'-phosphate glycosidase
MFLRARASLSPWRTCRRRFHGSCRRNGRLALTGLGKLRIAEEVEHALAHEQPVVALESAIITHGLPKGDNFKTAEELEAIVRRHGAVPATIAVLDGAIRVGLSPSQLSHISEEENSVKLSKRDLQTALSLNLTGGTTCAATMFIANMCSIGVFATGGLGGVHRGGESCK